MYQNTSKMHQKCSKNHPDINKYLAKMGFEKTCFLMIFDPGLEPDINKYRAKLGAKTSQE